MLNTAFAVKSQLTEDASPYKAYLMSKMTGFWEEYSGVFESIRPLLTINAKDINNKFKELSKLVGVPGDSKIHDYNYYVDEILQISPPYSQDVKEETSQLSKKISNTEVKPSDLASIENNLNSEVSTGFYSSWEETGIKPE